MKLNKRRASTVFVDPNRAESKLRQLRRSGKDNVVTPSSVRKQSAKLTKTNGELWVDELQRFLVEKRDDLNARQYTKMVQDIDKFLRREEDSLCRRFPTDRGRIVADLYCIYSEGLGALGEYDRAREASQQAVDLCPNWYRGYSTLAQIVAFRLQPPMHSKAIKLFEMALKKEMTEEERAQVQGRYEDLLLIYESSDSETESEEELNPTLDHHINVVTVKVDGDHLLFGNSVDGEEEGGTKKNQNHPIHQTDSPSKASTNTDNVSLDRAEEDGPMDTDPVQTGNVENLGTAPHEESSDEYVEDQRSETKDEIGNAPNSDDQNADHPDTTTNTNCNIKTEDVSLSQRGASGASLDDRKGDISKMSAAQRKAFEGKVKYPNAYYYRFNESLECQRLGDWTADEHKLFMERVRDKGVNKEWGLFSKVIPGRVGYACSNYWIELLKKGWIQDENRTKVECKGKNGQKVKPKWRFRRKKEIVDEAVNPGKDYFDRFRKYQFVVLYVCDIFIAPLQCTL